MSLCIQCLKDSKEHTKTEWRRHQDSINAVKVLTVQCEFCRRKKGVHSDELWEIHDNIVKNACLENRVRRADLGLINEYGRIRPYPAIIEKQLMADGSVNIVPRPIFMKCKHKISENKICGKYLGNDEEDLADVIGEMCFKCFCEETGQEYTWETVTPTFDEVENRRKRRNCSCYTTEHFCDNCRALNSEVD